ncbi:hypothetical protein [Glaciecola petra]|uniref:Uncharacterized protein n=1 Tax=Glaciecola petra TaxID=3075602 RepID=A0ABU2ZMF9_9ALTE|nr:hypothetical protein [Aestuariibacter sp. P117]MDT0593800.1 hypothetical protein [Aestuariibacter sp. P117]
MKTTLKPAGQPSKISNFINAELDHSDTPSELADINKHLLKLFNCNVEQDADGTLSQAIDEDIEKFILKRANLVESLLNTLQEQQKLSFARKEIDINKVLLGAVELKRKHVRENLANISKASKAIKEYHQV